MMINVLLYYQDEIDILYLKKFLQLYFIALVWNEYFNAEKLIHAWGGHSTVCHVTGGGGNCTVGPFYIITKMNPKKIFINCLFSDYFIKQRSQNIQ